MFFKSKSERNFDKANRGIAAYVAMYQKAAEAAEQELSKLSKMVADKIDQYDSKIEAAYSRYMRVEDKYNEKCNKIVEFGDTRKAELETIAEQAKKAVDAHNAIYLGK